MNNIEILEKLADNEHNRWANWQKYVHSKCMKNKDGSLTIPKEYVEHWNYEINTKYKDLPENIKESDRNEVRQILKLLNVENLIKENKELKEKREEYEKQLDLDYVKENYIPKSKIEKALDKMNERYMTPEAISNSNGATFNYWTGKRDMCIELLEKGE